jgi:hypothetical protein
MFHFEGILHEKAHSTCKNWRSIFATLFISPRLNTKHTSIKHTPAHHSLPKPINKHTFVDDQLTCIHTPSLATMMNYTSFLTFLLLVTSASAHPVLRGTESSVRLLKKDKQNKKERTTSESTAAESSIPVCAEGECRAPDNTCKTKLSCFANYCEVEELNPCSSSGQTCTWNECGACKAICSD